MAEEESFSKGATKTVINFLQANIPKKDVPNLEIELKKDIILAKTRGKAYKKKPKKKKLQNLTRQEKKALGFYVIPRYSIKYEDVLPMHEMWTDYVFELLELDHPVPECASKRWDNFTLTLYKADYHGSLLKVVRSKCPSLVDKVGICIMDTRNTFKIVSKNNVVTTIPKRDSVFEIHIKHVKLTLFGKHLCVRPAERSTKKVKNLLHPDL